MKSEHKVWTVAAGLFLAGVILLAARCAKAEPIYVNKCSGVYIGEGYVLTAGHCVVGETETILRKDKVKEEDEDTDKGGWTAKVVVTDHLHDLAIVKFDKIMTKKTEKDKDEWKPEAIKDPLPFTATKVSCDYPKMMKHYVIKGWPAFAGYTEVIGYVAGDKKKRGPWDVSYVVVAPIWFGNSGSGAYDQITDRVEMIMVGLVPGSTLAIGVPTAEICSFLPREIK